MDKNKTEMLDKLCKQFGSLKDLNPPMRIDWMASVGWHLLYDRKNLNGVCLVYLHVENAIGIADEGQRGYTRTPCVIYDGVNGEDAVNWFNENILGLTQDECSKIVLSTMRESTDEDLITCCGCGELFPVDELTEIEDGVYSCSVDCSKEHHLMED